MSLNNPLSSQNSVGSYQSTPIISSTNSHPDSENGIVATERATETGTPQKARNAVISPSNNSLSPISGSSMSTLATIPFLIFLHFLKLIQEFVTRSGRTVSLQWSNYYAGMGEVEQRIVNEEVPNMQRQIKKDLDVVSTGQKVMSNQIDDLKEKVRKMTERQEQRLRARDLRNVEGQSSGGVEETNQ